jgi:ferredoxin
MSEDCLGCGLCAVACPTGAIDVAGFDAPPSTGARIHIECSRVPAGLLEADSWVVPCAGGLTISDLVATAEKQGDKASIALVDRGLCDGCLIAGGQNKIAEVCTKFSNTLERIESDAIHLERIERQIAPAEARPPGSRPPSSRRTFLRSFIAPPRAKRPVGIQQERATVARLEARSGHSLGGSFYPAIAVSENCRDHGVCAASCPTGALRRETSGASDEIRRLTFDPAQCVSCRRCAEVCPGQALTFMASGAKQMQSDAVVLRETQLSVCPRCDEAYVDDNVAQDCCPSCRKNQSLFADLFSAHRRSPVVSESDIADEMV